MNLFTFLEHSARRYPRNDAIFFGTTRIFTYSELHDRALRLAGAVMTLTARGDRIGIYSRNCPEYVELLFAIWAAGRVAVPVNFKLHPREVGEIMVDAEAQMLFVSADLADGIADMALPHRIVIGGADYAGLLDHDPVRPVQTEPTDLAWMFFTSGTTGRAKGAMLSHRNLLTMATAHLADFESVEAEHSLIHAAPMSHGSGIYLIPYVARAARQVIATAASFDAGEVLDLCDYHPGCGMFLAPTMVQRLRREAEASHKRPNNLRTILYGGGPMYLDEIRRSLEVFGQVFIQLYGQGEAPVTITGLRRRDHQTADDAVLSSVGWPRTGIEVRIVDADGQELPQGEIGEVACRGDVVMAGYWNNAEATAAALRDGWLWTGDMGAMDETGMLTLLDRSKDMIISGGSNIYPREVEEVLLCHPAVAEVSVVGRKDDEWGEVAVAFVVTAPDCRVGADELDRYCLAAIARFKRPKEYRFVTELPKSAYGKVLKRELVKMLETAKS